MLAYVIRELRFEPLKSCLIVFSVASALALALVLEGFYLGLLKQLEQSVMNRGADLIVAQSGVSNFAATRSKLPQLSRERIEALEGVDVAHPITMFPIIYSQEGYRRSPVFIQVYDTFGGPQTLANGSLPEHARDIVIDQALARLYRLELGSSFIVSDFEFRIAGISKGDSALFTAYAYIRYDDMLDFFFDSDLVGDLGQLPLLSFLLLELDATADQVDVQREIEKIELSADVFLPDSLADNDIKMGKALFGPVLNVLVNASYMITLLVISMIIFASIHHRARQLGVLKALGFSRRQLSHASLIEALIIVIAAFPLAIVLALMTAVLIEYYVPLYLIVVLDLALLVKTLVAAVFIGSLAGYLPSRQLSKLDPALAFKG